MDFNKDYLKDLFMDEVKGCLEGDFSGSYNDLSDKPTIPTVPSKVSAFANDAGYQTESQVNVLINTALGVIENGTY